MRYPSLRTLFKQLASGRRNRRRRRPERLSFRPYVTTLEDRSLPSTTTWTGLGSNTNWSNPANWNNGVPGAGDTAVFNSSSGTHNQAILDAAAAGAVAALDINWSGTLTLARSLSVTQEMTLANGTVTGAGDLTAGGSLTWSGGTLSGTGNTTVTQGATLTLSGGSKTLDHRGFTNAGTGMWQGTGSFQITNGAVFLNQGSFDDQNNQSVSDNAGTFTNSGTFTKSAGTGTTSFGTTFNNNGRVLVQVGTVNLTNGGSSGGTFTVAAQATLQFGGGTSTLTPNATVSGAGLVNVTSGTVNVNGSLNVTGTTQVAGGTANFNHAAASLGTVTISNGTANFSTGAALTIATLTFSGGTLTGSDNLTVTTLNWSGGGTMSGTGATIVPAGSGHLNLTANANKTLNRTLTNLGKWTYIGNSGIGGTGTINNGGSFEDQSNPTFSGGLVFNNSGTYLKSPGTNTTKFQDTVAFNNAGTVTVMSGTLDLAGGNDTSSGRFVVDPAATLQFEGHTHTLTAASGVSGAGTVVFHGGITNVGGTYDVDGGQTVFNSAFATATFTGPVYGLGTTLDMQGGGTADFSGGVPISVADLFLSNFATLTGSDELTVTDQFGWASGVMRGTGSTTVADTATLTLTGGEVDQRTFTNDGVVNWNSGNFTLNDGSVFTNNGVIYDNADHSFSSNGATFANAGAYVKTGGTGTTNFGNLTFNDSGYVDVQSGTVALNGGGAEDGGFYVEDGATLDLNSGTFVFSASSAVVGFNSGTVILNSNTTVGGVYDLGTGTTKIPNTFAQVFFTYPVDSVGSVLNVDGYVDFSGGNPITVDTLTLTTFGTLTGSDDVYVTGTMSWSGGNMSGAGTTIILDGATVTFAGAQYANLRGGRGFANYGTADWAGSGDLTLNDGSSFANYGTFIDQNDHGLSGNGGVFANYGVFAKVGGTGTTSVANNVTFLNGGLFSLQSGTFYVAGLYEQVTGQTDLAAETVLTATGGVEIDDGVLSGYGTVQANVTNSGTLLPGEDGAPGVLVINGNYTQTAAGTLDVQIGATGAAGFDQLAISGTATLDGTLNVTLLGGYVPNSGDSFPVMTFAAEVGSFAAVTGDGPLFTVVYDPNDVTLVAN